MPARAVAVALAAVAVLAAAGPAPGAVRVWFAQGPVLAPVERPGSGVRRAVEALLAGPTRAERARGLRSRLPGGTVVRKVSVSRRVVTLDLAARAVGSPSRDTVRDRVRQLVLTAGGVAGVQGVRVLVEGGTPLGLTPGIDLRRPVTAAAVRDAGGAGGPPLRRLQQHLADLGFMTDAGITGVPDDRTTVAVLAFQKWARLPRDGELGAGTTSRLLLAARPEPVRGASGTRIEVLLDRQLALLVQDDKVLRTVHISTGAPGWSTPTGSFRIYRKEQMSWSVPFQVWMPWASYFTGGIAFHQYPVVPTYPASHGCVRVNAYDARLLYEFAVHGTPVEVLWRS